MIKAAAIIIALGLVVPIVKGQSELDRILAEVESNNKSIAAETLYWEAQKLFYKTGLSPDNPMVEYDHLPGRPQGAGTQQDFAVTQGFDFPTSYEKRRGLSTEQIAQGHLQANIFRQNILLEAKIACLEYIYRTKLHQELDKRLQNANKLLRAIDKQTQQGESNVLDLNKIKLLQLEIKNQADLNTASLKTVQHQLDQLNGGLPLDLSHIEYPVLSGLPDFDLMDSLIEANDPEVKAVEQKRDVNRRQVELTRSMTLPKLEGGYHQQSILGQRYQGFHVGMTIPLWENKNKVKTERARLSHSEYAITEHRIEHHYRNKKLYEQYLHWQNTLNEYQNVLTSANNEDLLNKAFQAGQISLIEYLMELRYFFDAIDQLKAAEKEYHQAIAGLYKFQL